MAGLVSFGICAVCGARVKKSAVRAHLKKCLAWNGQGPRGQILIVRAQPPDAAFYWLEIAVGPKAKLQALDTLLRRVWVECCGHLSEFSTGGQRTLALNTAVNEVLGAPGSRVNYVYDFGSSTELTLNHTAVVGGAPVKGAQLVVRNEAPTWPCGTCGEPATMICMEWATPNEAFCCATHAKDYKDGEDMLLPVVNSPRMGVCGYTGEE